LTALGCVQDEGVELNGRRRDGRSVRWMEYSTDDEFDTVSQQQEDIGRGQWHPSWENQMNSTRLHRGDSKAGVLRNHPERHQLLPKPMSSDKETQAALQPMLRRLNSWRDMREESYPDDTEHYVSSAHRKTLVSNGVTRESTDNRQSSSEVGQRLMQRPYRRQAPVQLQQERSTSFDEEERSQSLRNALSSAIMSRNQSNAKPTVACSN
jgi:hypothetical protein